MSLSQPQTRVATLVPEDRRPEFLPELFGLQFLIMAENTLYYMMEWLSPEDYGGGFWDFYELDGKPLYLVPPKKPRYRIICRTNDYSGEVTTDAAGIIATLFTFSHLSIKFESSRMAEGYHRLFSYAGDHLEASQIFQAID
ncbi:antirestriction protein [Chelativorans sp. AA-79]|uniref:antirestriction protein n=1 Tax=Chelativorans sp. AA-79 TaxID=3028735 RepID=UPI0023F881A5|nr:antirestriction protein [Chelativorans sp. AA-79]WEX12364.1 antirestriction protein [Chelativorans sp. AA-79]